MKHTLLFFLLVIAANFASAQNQPPALSNVTVSVDWIAKTMTIHYDVADAENDLLTVQPELSGNNGLSYALTPQAVFSGDTGSGITSGTGKSISVDLSAITPQPGGLYKIRLTADDGQPFDIQSIVDQVDSTRLRSDLEFIQGIRHRSTGVAHLNASRDSLQHCLENAGFATNQQTWSVTTYTARNVFGTNRGVVAPNNVVIVDAHYDTVSNAPGADDNGSGVVGVMEIARLLGKYPSKKTLRCIGFDLEESGLVGSIKYVQGGIPAGETIDGVLNFEMIGYYSDQPNTQTLPAGFNLLFPDAYNQVVANQYRGDFITNVGNTASSSLINLFNASAAAYVPELKVTSLEVPGNGELVPDLRRSDHAPFWSGGYKALMLTDGANFRNECYHTAQDTLGNKLNFTFMSQVVKASLATAATLIEPIHGAMAVATVDSPSGVSEIADCNISASVAGGKLLFRNGQCAWSDLDFTMYDMNGRLVWQHRLKGRGDVDQQFDLPVIPGGTYVLHVLATEGSWSQKVLIK